ncbi:hypothetical protein M2428_000602 [Arthrobacter sp. ES3-54]|nr:hypothetical protein [Arthrobacter sp. ES3-54]
MPRPSASPDRDGSRGRCRCGIDEHRSSSGCCSGRRGGRPGSVSYVRGPPYSRSRADCSRRGCAERHPHAAPVDRGPRGVCIVLLLVSETPGTKSQRLSVRRPRQRSPGAGATRVSDGSRGTPTTRQRWWGKGAQRPKDRRLRRPLKRSAVPVPLMPFSSFRRIWSSSGRSTGFLLVRQRKVAPTAPLRPDHLWLLPVGGSGRVALVSVGSGRFGSDRISLCVTPGRNAVCSFRLGIDVSTLLCQPTHFHCPRVDTGLTLARHSAGFGLVAVHAFSRRMTPRGQGAAKPR